jgi:integrase
MAKVTLREQFTTKGMVSLFLDIYPPVELNGKQTRRHFLKIHTYPDPKRKHPKLLFKALTPLQKDHRKQAYQRAEQLLTNFQNKLAKEDLYTPLEREYLAKKAVMQGSFIDFIYDQAKQKDTRSTETLWRLVGDHLLAFHGKDVKFSDVNIDFAEGFKMYLKNYTKPVNKRRPRELVNISNNTQLLYHSTFMSAVDAARRRGFVTESVYVKPLKKEEKLKLFFTLDDLKLLAVTPAPTEDLRRAGLFSALTGLRYKELRPLKWSNIVGNELFFHNEKGNADAKQLLSAEVLEILGERKHADDFLFPNLSQSEAANVRLWCERAGVKKQGKVVFHTFRHTFVTLQIGAGTHGAVVQQLARHKSFSTTAGYISMLDKDKIKASEAISLK